MYGNPYFAQQSRFQPMTNQTTMPTQPYIQPMQPLSNPTSLLGKAVESIDVVKAMDIPLDGSVSYFPLTDGSAVVTKQLQTDGTSKITIYKPITEEKAEVPKYATMEDVEKAINKLVLTDIDDIKEDMQEIKKQLKGIKKVKED